MYIAIMCKVGANFGHKEQVPTVRQHYIQHRKHDIKVTCFKMSVLAVRISFHSQRDGLSDRSYSVKRN